MLERKLWVPIPTLSDAPEGRAEDGLPQDYDALGTIPTKEGPIELRLRRGAGRLWRFSPDTVARVPELYAGLGVAPLDRVLPASFTSRTFLGMAPAHWLGIAALALLSFLLAWLITPLVVRLTRPLAGLRRGEHTVLEYFINLLGARSRAAVVAFTNAVGIVLFLYLIKLSLVLVPNAQLQSSPGLGLPLGWVFAAIPVGAALIVLPMLRNIRAALRGPWPRRS